MVIRLISNINKWDGSKIVNREDAYICGDAFSDLKTTENRLSVWKADTKDDINDAIVALALNRDSVCKINYFLLNEEKLAEMGIDIVNDQEGIAKGLLDSTVLKKHRDLTDIDYWRLGFLAEYMLQLAKTEDNRNVVSKLEVKKLLIQYKEANKIDPGLMNARLKEDLKW